MAPDNPPDVRELVDIDRIIHEPARAAIMAVLYGVDSADFKFLLRMTQLTKGNLSAHTRKLQEAKYLTITKSFKKNYPHTEYKLTQEGRRAFRTYAKKIRSLSNFVE